MTTALWNSLEVYLWQVRCCNLHLYILCIHFHFIFGNWGWSCHLSLIYYNTNFPHLFPVISFIAALGFLLYGGRWVLWIILIDYYYLSHWYVMHGCNSVFLGYVISNSSRLFFMLRRFPIESKGRRKKLHEVCACLL